MPERRFMCVDCGAPKSCYAYQDHCAKCQGARQEAADEREHERRAAIYAEALERRKGGAHGPYTRPIKFGRRRC